MSFEVIAILFHALIVTMAMMICANSFYSKNAAALA